ncbi:predicted protein [Sclerotinia sclerotiorum 1980 UF-70]|uniref:Uncharacterized protein n=1 Tax=Sclerotinia sclerotiorum (strain ATCC 18683 / 1980 / Ss-1) TaxID=665079 RepID=A7F2Y4_SCLS1|nr:predicted protein [Sclerotinia sclerotiorum 1980 UF-70]EDN96076.1 predicted protein [Sclerotinia sclerotiorum 1980 UF-70]
MIKYGGYGKCSVWTYGSLGSLGSLRSLSGCKVDEVDEVDVDVRRMASQSSLGKNEVCCGCMWMFWMFVDESGCRMVGWIGEGEGEGCDCEDEPIEKGLGGMGGDMGYTGQEKEIMYEVAMSLKYSSRSTGIGRLDNLCAQYADSDAESHMGLGLTQFKMDSVQDRLS